jgi:uncharacterized protein YutE (UPF0331/DUF86 family)
LAELSERLQRLHPLQEKASTDFEEDPYLRDIAERNLEVAAQCCIDVCNRIIALENAPKPAEYYEAIRHQGELGVRPSEFADRLAPPAGFRNVLAQQYLGVNWDEVYSHLQQLDDPDRFSRHIRQWLQMQE